ncbi:styrene monooxygenase/indole monooxygenase family protein [Streptomyces sp. NPDC101132]|uniref:styrene monooxygenase/indole monooxygenase family protein n=1 Tax=Streptomyces sp. NPDC101132 TaxID=3366110 RepID=UPI00382A3D29
MRRIAIVGAGQAGLHLALGLQRHGYDVTLTAARTAGQVREGHPLSTQAMFGPARSLERALGLDLWAERTPLVRDMTFTLAGPDGARLTGFGARLDDGQQSVDQRVKLPAWLDLFEERGGRTEYRTVDRDGLARLAAGHDLTLVAAGRGGISALFPADAAHSPYEKPQRTLACCYLHGVGTPPGPGAEHARITAVTGGGELFLQPALTLSGPCTILLWEALPGGPLDVFADRPGPAGFLERSLGLLRRHVPWEYEWCRGAEPTDARATLYGALTPRVRHPVALPAPGSPVLGMADTLVLNDPVTGQGANNAARCAATYLREILAHGERPFDEAWMRRTHALFWEHARYSVAFTNLMLQAPPPPHVRRVLGAAAAVPPVADRFAAAYADPAGLEDWLLDPDRTDAWLGWSPARPS